MCDTWVALPDATASGQVIFAKNSDRPAFDCQPLVFRAARDWPPHAKIAAEYLELDQAPHTHAHIGSRPYWCFGYESGLNEHGVAIGNEAIFTRVHRAAVARQRAGRPDPLGLLGMDVIRLALERTASARSAVELIGRLVEQHGQFGSGVPGRDHASGGYDNSYLVADPTEAWVLETAGRQWAARRFPRGYTSISNQPTLRTERDLASRGLQEDAIAQHWWQDDREAPFDFARAYADELVPRQVSHLRVMRSRELLRREAGRIDVSWMKRIARDHYEDTFLEGPLFNPADPDVLTLCMHDSPAGFTWGNTATSCVATLPRTPGDLPIFWWTPGPPCNGCYVPFFVEAGAPPPMVSEPGTRGAAVTRPDQTAPDEYSDRSYWWLFRRLLDATTAGAGHRGSLYAERNRAVRARFDSLETAFENELPGVMRDFARAKDSAAGAALLAAFTGSCVDRVLAATHELLREFNAR